MSWARCRVFRLAPCELLPGGQEGRAAFEIVWGLIAVPRGNALQSFGFVGDLFVKGASSRFGSSARRWWRASRIRAEVKALRRMKARGVPVPEVVAWGRETLLGLSRRAFLIQRRLAGATTLQDLIRAGGDEDPRRRMLEAAGSAVARMHRVGFFHRDLALRNVLVRLGAGEPEICLIDCPRAERGWLPVRRGFLRRSDAFRLARGLVRVGLSREAAKVAISTVAGREAERILDLAGTVRRAGRGRGLRTSLFLWFGV